jgi:NAD(P)H dehydrogenase (quinone)
MARAQAEGAARVAGVDVTVKRVPELVPPDVCKSSGYKLDQDAAIADPLELERYDGIVFGTPTRFGNMAAQMRNFLDQTGPLWVRNALVGKVGSVFCCTASQHGGQETTLTTFHATLLHHGMVVVGLPYTFKELTTMREVTGGTPYGASSITGPFTQMRMPTPLELEMCRFQGEHVARITSRIVAGAKSGV